jgi:hypothetical protein
MPGYAKIFLNIKKKYLDLIELFNIIVKLNPSKFYASGSLFALVLAQYHIHIVKLESTSIMHYYGGENECICLTILLT